MAAVIALGGGGSDSADSHGKSPANLTLVGMVVRDVERGPNPRRSHLEIALHNAGGQRVVIDRADIEIRHVHELRRCASQDDLPLSNVYGVSLPTDARPGEVLKLPLHQQLGPDEADRFAISLSPKPRAAETGSFYLFELDLTLHDDGPQSALSVGSALISLPQIPIPGEYYWGADTAQLIRGLAVTSPQYVSEMRRYSMPCWRSNTAALRRALAGPAVHSAYLEAIEKELVTPTFAAIE